jgi:protein arginine N-methyltransferase 1
MTIKKEDLAFKSRFKIVCSRHDYCHALLAYFDCTFTRCHKPITFSTGPLSDYTHWKQTIFYLYDALSCCGGDVIQGELSCSPNSSNPRDLDISIDVHFDGSKSSYYRSHSYKLR